MTANIHSTKPIRIGLVVGETSGAIIAVGMVKQLLLQHPNAIIEGIGSKELIGLGMHSLFDMEELSVMGLVEVLKHLPRLLHIRKTVVQHFIENPPDVFIGVDAPDFNLTVETKLKAAGIPTVHYVSPTVWAWREKRIFKIAKATDLVLGVFPFEQAIYDKYGIAFKFVGHTMADDIPLQVDQANARASLQLDDKRDYLALLPGSRAREVDTLFSTFLTTFELLKQKKPDLLALIPAVNDAREAQINAIIQDRGLQQYCTVTRAKARDVMLASDAVLLASGTAALEAMFCKCPMVVAYKMPAITHIIMKQLYKPDYFALPNILADELLVPEFLQDDVNAPNLAEYVWRVWQQDNAKIVDKFTSIHTSLAKGADLESANAVLALIAERDLKTRQESIT
ncbi:MAG: lipid-A-disaccharide synthase [Glaciecola sp.]